MLQQPLQQKQITNSKRLILAARRHVASRAREGGKDFARGAFAIPIEGGVERGRTTLGDRSRDTSRMLVRRRGFWLGSAHGAASANQSAVPYHQAVGGGDIVFRQNMGEQFRLV